MKLLLVSALLGCFILGCAKVENTTPRYDPKECPFCTKEAGKCGYCKGTAKCSFCRGTGTRVEGTSKVSYEVKCNFCGGTGKCIYCDAKGACKHCDGTGEIKDWDWLGASGDSAWKSQKPEQKSGD
jgi:DnaJ-class molecular chaperone